MSENGIEYRCATLADRAAIQQLLQASHLPNEDLQTSGVRLIVSVLKGEIIGCIGIEVKDEDGLLRSFAVSEPYRNKGVGNALFKQLLLYAKSNNINKLHLLTTTAEKYFSTKGFITSHRSAAPDSIQATSEFATLCPSDSTYMYLDIGSSYRESPQALKN